MDGGRRLLRSLTEAARALAAPSSAHAPPAFAGSLGGLTHARSIPMPAACAPAPPIARARRAERRGWRVLRLHALAALRMPGVGSALAVGLLVAAALTGAVCGGQYTAFVEANGAVGDVLARALGFGIDAVTITGARELSVKEILAGAGVDQRSSLLFVNAADIRARLLAMPLVQDAGVHKLFPNRLVITITERRPFALWQMNGVVSVIAADGTAIDKMRDQRFDDLPFVVGDDANAHVAEFMRLLDAAGDLRPQIRAGVYIGDRRWNLNLKNGLEVRLPEINPEPAVAEFASMVDRSQLLDKDLISVDMRMPGRLVARISEEAQAARAQMLARKHKKGGPM